MAAVNTQFSIGIHILVAIGSAGCSMTSTELAASVNAYPSFVRRILSKLAKAGLIKTSKGKGGCCTLSRKASEITLLEVYRAVEAPKAFAIHAYPVEKRCKVSHGIKSCLSKVLDQAQRALEESLDRTTLASVMGDFSK